MKHVAKMRKEVVEILICCCRNTEVLLQKSLNSVVQPIWFSLAFATDLSGCAHSCHGVLNLDHHGQELSQIPGRWTYCSAPEATRVHRHPPDCRQRWMLWHLFLCHILSGGEGSTNGWGKDLSVVFFLAQLHHPLEREEFLGWDGQEEEEDKWRGRHAEVTSNQATTMTAFWSSLSQMPILLLRERPSPEHINGRRGTQPALRGRQRRGVDAEARFWKHTKMYPPDCILAPWAALA